MPKIVERDEKTAELIKRAILAGFPIKKIAKVVAVSENVMRRIYKDEVENTKLKCGANVAGMLYNKCLKGDTASVIFYCKTQLGFKETQSHELSGTDGQPLQALQPPALHITIDGAPAEITSEAGPSLPEPSK